MLTHLGAKNCVTGSCHLLQTHPGAAAAGVNILVDCGSAYGNDPELPFDRFPVQPGEIDYLFLTHAHIDHIGRVPDLIDAGFRGEIICTHATKALLIPMLHDAMSFSDRTGKEVNRMEKLIEELSWGFELHDTFSLKQDITFKMSNAGHILGSCFIRFEIPIDETHGDMTLRHSGENRNPDLFTESGSCPQTDKEQPLTVNRKLSLTVNRKPFSIIFSGDLGCTDTPILPDPDPPDACDLLVMESTYGDRNHIGRKDRVATLEKLLHKALADKGIVYIPAFSLGRTQELIYELDRIMTSGDMTRRSLPGFRQPSTVNRKPFSRTENNIPVFIDSPLGLKITKIYSDLEQYWDKEAKDLKARGDHPIDFKNLYSVEKYRDHKRLLDIKGPAIIIAGSGMCTGGRIVEHLKHGLQDSANDIFFVGYQAKGTPGRRMIEKQIPVKAGIHTLTGYSAHADQNTLINWVKSMPQPPKEIRLVHGEDHARQALAKKLEGVCLSSTTVNREP